MSWKSANLSPSVSDVQRARVVLVEAIEDVLHLADFNSHRPQKTTPEVLQKLVPKTSFGFVDF